MNKYSVYKTEELLDQYNKLKIKKENSSNDEKINIEKEIDELFDEVESRGIILLLLLNLLTKE